MVLVLPLLLLSIFCCTIVWLFRVSTRWSVSLKSLSWGSLDSYQVGFLFSQSLAMRKTKGEPCCTPVVMANLSNCPCRSLWPLNSYVALSGWWSLRVSLNDQGVSQELSFPGFLQVFLLAVHQVQLMLTHCYKIWNNLKPKSLVVLCILRKSVGYFIHWKEFHTNGWPHSSSYNN